MASTWPEALFLVRHGQGRRHVGGASDGRRWHVRGGGTGLSTTGSGDVLAGVVAGLAARADEPAQAAVHAVHAHAEAGRRVAQRVGRLGFLARGLLDDVPGILDELAP